MLLDTTHTYEVCLWHNVLDSMPRDPALTGVQQRQLEALCRKFAAFPALGTDLVPEYSMLREFIGPKADVNSRKIYISALQTPGNPL